MTARPRPPAPWLVPLWLGLLALGARGAAAEPPPAEPPPGGEAPALTEGARRHAIKGLKSRLRKLARSPHAAQKGPEIRETLESLGALGGPAAAEAALEAVVLADAPVRDAVFALVERERHADLVAPLAGLLEGNEFRRDADLRRRVAHALAVMADPAAVEPLASLLRFDEDAEVVAEAGRALAVYPRAPLKERKEAVRRLVDLYETTWNYKMSVRPEDKVLSRIATERWGVYSQALRGALQALTGAALTRPKEWRDWWNANKKRPTWDKER